MTPTKLIVRLTSMRDDKNRTWGEAHAMAEMVICLVSLRLFVCPFVPVHLFVYTSQDCLDRIREVVAATGWKDELSILLMNTPEDKAFADSIINCTPVDRICIQRMLKDFRELPPGPRLLLGTDVYFFAPPTELLDFVHHSAPDARVIYMVDNFSFGGELYRLPYHHGPMLAGLAGDFYCLSPQATLTLDDIRSCLRTIDAWPRQGRWSHALPESMKDAVHACEQQAAAILMARFHATQLPVERYNHQVARPQCVVLHSHHYDQAFGPPPAVPEVHRQAERAWRRLGYLSLETVNELRTVKSEIRHTLRRVKRKVKSALRR